jgi:hypothetical protein
MVPVPVTRRGSWTRSRAWPDEAEEFPAVLVAPLTAADELGGAVRAEMAAEEQEERPSARAAAATQARR